MSFRLSKLPLTGKFGVAAAGLGAMVGLLALSPAAAFAAGGPAPGGPGGSNFELNSFTVTPVKGTTDEFYLNVSVSQTSADGSDFGTGTTETHPFPQNLYFYIANSSGTPINSNLLDATFVSSSPANGITYQKNETESVTGTAQYEVTIPPSDYSASDELLIYPYSNGPGSDYNNKTYAFRMGYPSDTSFSDDVISGTTNITIPVGQLPEVPYAAALPAAAVLGAGALWLRRRRASARS